MKTRNSIKLVLIALLFNVLFLNNVHAQRGGIFILDDEEEIGNNRLRSDEFPGGFIIPDMPEHDSAYDYTPIGDGLWLLGCLGGAYLLGKRRKDKEK